MTKKGRPVRFVFLFDLNLKGKGQRWFFMSRVYIITGAKGRLASTIIRYWSAAHCALRTSVADTVAGLCGQPVVLEDGMSI